MNDCRKCGEPYCVCGDRSESTETLGGHTVKTLAVALGVGACLLASCSGAQGKSQATYAAIVAGCKVSLDLDRDAGAAGAVDAEARGCDATLKVWEARP